MDPRSALQEIWQLYTYKNADEYFQDYVVKFGQVYAAVHDTEFAFLSHGGRKDGPHLSDLSDELLPGLGVHLYRYQEQATEKGFTGPLLNQAASAIKCLAILCRNFDNIPFVASCDFICDIVSLSLLVVGNANWSTEEEKSVATTFLHEVLYLFECLYDPYSLWRAKRLRQDVNMSGRPFQPAVLHIEIIPFFYDFFQSDFTCWPPDIPVHFLHVFGAILSGAQHNAMKIVCPATLEVLYRVLDSSDQSLELKLLVMDCLLLVMHQLWHSPPDQQVDLTAVLGDWRRSLTSLTSATRIHTEVSLVVEMLDAVASVVSELDSPVIRSALGNEEWVCLLMQISTNLSVLSRDDTLLMALALLKVFLVLCLKNSATKARLGLEWLLPLLRHTLPLSEEVLTATLNLACEEEVNLDQRRVVRNAGVVIVLLRLLPSLDEQQQGWLADELWQYCSEDLGSRICCCSAGVVSSILTLLADHQLESSGCSGVLVKLVEVFGCESIRPAELKQLFLLLRPTEEGQQFPLTTQIIHTVSSMAKKDGYAGAHYFWDFQDLSHAIIIPGIRRWPGFGFSFHAWVRLDRRADSTAVLYRRQLYSFYTSSATGFEAFFLPDGTLVAAVCIKKEFLTASVMDVTLDDGLWHCVDICHTSSRRPFTQSQLSVFVDGRPRVTVQVKCLSMAEPFTYCRVGSPGPRTNVRGSDEIQPLSASDKLLSTLPAFFSLPMPLRTSGPQDPQVKALATGMQDKLWGPLVSLRGQISSVAVFSEALTSAQVKTLFSAGCSSLTVLATEDSGETPDLAAKLVCYYHAKACQDSTCLDLSPAAAHDCKVTAPRYEQVDVRDAINCIGGIPALFPILENAANADPRSPLAAPKVRPSSSEGEDEDWVVLPSSRLPGSRCSDERLERNQVAAFLLLLRNFIQAHSGNQEQLAHTHGIVVVGHLLQKVPGSLVDVHVLMAVQLLVEGVSSNAKNDRPLLLAMYQHVLFDFRIWNKSEFPVRIGHIQYLSTIIKDDRRFFRKRYGVQFLLDTIRQFYSSSDCVTTDDLHTIRMALLGLVKYFISREANSVEVSAILGFLVSVRNEAMIVEVLNTFLTILEGPHCHDQVFLLLLEPAAAELLYGLLIQRSFSSLVRQRILKVLYCLLKTDHVYNKYKSRLRLQDVGFPGFTSHLQGQALSADEVGLLLDIVLLADKSSTYQSLLAILQLIRDCDLEIKLQVATKLGETLARRPNAPQLLAVQQSWQDSVLYLLVKQPITSSSMEVDSIASKAMADVVLAPTGTWGEATTNGDLADGLVNDDEIATITTATSIASPLSSSPTAEPDIRSLDERGSISDSSSEDFSPSNVSPSPSSIDSKPVCTTDTDPEADARSSSLDTHESKDREQELLHQVASVLALIFWKGIEGSDKQAWMERGRLFACINLLALNNELYVSHVELKRMVLEHAVHSAIQDLNDAGQLNLAHSENARELMKWLYDFVVVDPNRDHSKKLSLQLLEGVLCILDTLLVFEESPAAEEWTEMAHMGLSLLLACAASDCLELCAVATPKLHALVQTRALASTEETCFLLGSLDAILRRDVQENRQEHYSFLIPVMKALLERLGSSLEVQRLLPALPAHQRGPTFFEDFQAYAQTEEWLSFVERQVKPMMEKHMVPTLKPLPETMNDFWNVCYEATMVGIHTRNREWGECKLRFQTQVLQPFHARRSEDSSRFHQVVMQGLSCALQARRRWQLMRVSLMGPCGPWSDRTSMGNHWKLSPHENLSRMRLKLMPNLSFDLHMEASQLRDNMGVQRKPSQASSLPLSLAIEAKVGDLLEDVIPEEEELANLVTREVEVLDPPHKDKLLLSEDCELVTLMSVVKGRLEITITHVSFHDCSPVREEVERQDFRWSIAQLREVHLRRYNLRRSALELFLVDQTNYFLNFTTKTRHKVYSRLLSLRPPNLFTPSSRSPAELLRASGLTNKWVQREVSNFDYLMQLNTIAGRSYNDLSQYPVLPWVLCNYTAEELDLNDPAVFRDLSRPIGVVNPKKIPEVKAKYDDFEDTTGTFKKFHYGTHYSNSAGVLHYLVRVEPFTSLHVDLQSGRFDVADRQFHSIPATWRMLMESTSDVKELIPEFFYLPEFLVNMNKFDLGQLQETRKHVDDVELPRWAKNADDFIFKHRTALESEHVSNNLHKWIDLVFGYKQKGPAAVEALNVFFYCSYEGAVDLDNVSSDFEREQLEKMVNNFGQTPSQLLKEPHPRRLSLEEAEQRQLRGIINPPSVLLFPHQLKAFYMEVSSEQDPVVFVTIPRCQARSFIQQSLVDNLVTVSEAGILGVHGWLPYDKFIPNYFMFEKDPTLTNARTRRKVATFRHPGVPLTARLLTVTHDGRLLFTGGHWDNSIRVFSLVKGRTVSCVHGHLEIVTCLSIDRFGGRLISGSRDTTCAVWEVVQHGGTSQVLTPKPLRMLYGHNSPVTCAAIMTELDLAASGAQDGRINVHSIRDGVHLHSLMPPASDPHFPITLIELSDYGHIVAVSSSEPTAEEQRSMLRVFSINGRELASDSILPPITAMLVTGEHVITGSAKGHLVFRETHELRLVTSLSLHLPILHVSATSTVSHVLVALKDGKLIVVGLNRKGADKN